MDLMAAGGGAVDDVQLTPPVGRHSMAADRSVAATPRISLAARSTMAGIE